MHVKPDPRMESCEQNWQWCGKTPRTKTSVLRPQFLQNLRNVLVVGMRFHAPPLC